ncbi:cupin domain-containing protein [Tropicimonas sp. S265A]|uniref:cupin domain-containing protein n=1 Tax=Tropicimonas sp. S265A TaxID=3415134 RepID=UPI003C7EA43C
MPHPPLAIAALNVPPRISKSAYPPPFDSVVAGRTKRQLGNVFGVRNFGVNLTELAPGAQSALLHRHTKQDEFVYVLDGYPTLKTDQGEIVLAPGMCAGFPAAGIAHHLVNETWDTVRYLEIGDRTAGDEGRYPNDDLEAHLVDGKWVFTSKLGVPYD